MNKVILGFFDVFGTPQVPPKNIFFLNFFLSWNQEFLKVTETTFVLGSNHIFGPQKAVSPKTWILSLLTHFPSTEIANAGTLVSNSEPNFFVPDTLFKYNQGQKLDLNLYVYGISQDMKII